MDSHDCCLGHDGLMIADSPIVVQFTSSELSPQSSSPLHLQSSSTHSPLSQVNIPGNPHSDANPPVTDRTIEGKRTALTGVTLAWN